MKKLLIVSIILLATQQMQAQFIVIDPGHIVATVANGGILAKTNKVIKDANEIASNIRNTVQNIRELQQNIDGALWEVKALIKGDDFGFGNIEFEMDATARVSTNLGFYTQGIVEGDHPMIQGYSSANVTLGAEMMHRVLDFDFNEQLPTQANGLQGLMSEKLVNREVFAYASARKGIQVALTYNQLAEVMLTKAEQLNEMLRRSRSSHGSESALKMNEAERIQLLESTAAYVRKALDLRLMCDQLIKQEINRESPVQEETMDMYRTYLQLESYFSAPKGE